MTKYIASVRDKETKLLSIIESEYDRKSDFYSDLHGNGYSVRFISTEEKFDEDCQKWHERNERRKLISRRRTEINRRIREISRSRSQVRE